MTQYAIQDHFKNVDLMQNVTCPAFFVHGQRDQLIHFSHSQEMALACSGPVSLILPRIMDHNEFDFYDDLVDPFRDFLRQLNISTAPNPGEDTLFKFAEYLYIPPQAQIEVENK